MSRLPQTDTKSRQLFALTYTRGPTWKPALPLKEQGLSSHLERIRHSGEEGSIVIAGPCAEESGGLALLFAKGEVEALAFVSRILPWSLAR